MKIKRIQVKNIGPYVNENAFDFDVSDITKRMVLIGGKNGAGKTTLFNAIKICLYGCVAFVVRSRRLTKHLHRLAIFLFVKLHGYIECIQKFFSGSRFVKQRIISNQAVSFQRIGVKGFNSILRQQSIIVANIL